MTAVALHDGATIFIGCLPPSNRAVGHRTDTLVVTPVLGAGRDTNNDRLLHQHAGDRTDFRVVAFRVAGPGREAALGSLRSSLRSSLVETSANVSFAQPALPANVNL